MRKLWYMGLEKYKGRYTLQLQDWNERVFQRRGINYEIVQGETLNNDQSIVTGQVLDAHGRTYYGMSQLMNLIKKLKAGEVTNEDIIYFEDMFQPGIESLPYIFDQVASNFRPRIAFRCLAQSIDPDDFVHVWYEIVRVNTLSNTANSNTGPKITGNLVKNIWQTFDARLEHVFKVDDVFICNFSRFKFLN